MTKEITDLIGEGRTKWQNRAQGITGLALAGIFAYGATQVKGIPTKLLLSISSAYIGADSLSDVVTGYHHYLSYKIFEGVERMFNNQGGAKR